jgi:Ni,Fe-hydrogenase maturation factor
MRKKDRKKVIIFGIGNNSRQDDGLGWMFLNFLDGQNKNISFK